MKFQISGENANSRYFSPSKKMTNEFFPGGFKRDQKGPKGTENRPKRCEFRDYENFRVNIVPKKPFSLFFECE